MRDLVEHDMFDLAVQVIGVAGSEQ